MSERERFEAAVMALRLFVGAAYPVDIRLDPRGHRWSEAYLDQALATGVDALESIARSGQAASGSSQGARWHAGWLVSNSEGDEEFVNNESALVGRHYKGGAPLFLTASFERAGQPEAPTAAPLAWAVFAENGNLRLWSHTPHEASKIAKALGRPLIPLYAHPPARSGAGSEES